MLGRDVPAQTSQGDTNSPPPSTRSAPTSQGAPGAGASKIETVIGPNCSVNGVLQSDSGIRIDGVFDGQIRTAGNLVIAESAKVAAEVQADNVVISGALKGNITANRIEITATGKLWGDLTVNSLLLDEGAYLRGHTTMGGDLEPPRIEAPKVRSPRLANPDEGGNTHR